MIEWLRALPSWRQVLISTAMLVLAIAIVWLLLELVGP